MPSGTVQAIATTKAGKPVVTIDGQGYSTQLDVSQLRVGDQITFESNSKTYQDGHTHWFLNGFNVVQKAPAPTHAQPPISAPRANSEAQGGLSEAERIFAYGVVTAAITAKLIIDPEGVEKWVCAAKNSLRSQGE